MPARRRTLRPPRGRGAARRFCAGGDGGAARSAPPAEPPRGRTECRGGEYARGAAAAGAPPQRRTAAPRRPLRAGSAGCGGSCAHHGAVHLDGVRFVFFLSLLTLPAMWRWVVGRSAPPSPQRRCSRRSALRPPFGLSLRPPTPPAAPSRGAERSGTARSGDSAFRPGAARSVRPPPPPDPRSRCTAVPYTLKATRGENRQKEPLL